VDTHPASGQQLLGRKIEGWPQLRELALDAARAWSPFRMQHWDIALTRRGPVLMEMNFIGGIAACQLHGPPGLYTDQYLTFRETQSYNGTGD
jgi:hypothetical protein